MGFSRISITGFERQWILVFIPLAVVVVVVVDEVV